MSVNFERIAETRSKNTELTSITHVDGIEAPFVILLLPTSCVRHLSLRLRRRIWHRMTFRPLCQSRFSNSKIDGTDLTRSCHFFIAFSQTSMTPPPRRRSILPAKWSTRWHLRVCIVCCASWSIRRQLGIFRFFFKVLAQQHNRQEKIDYPCIKSRRNHCCPPHFASGETTAIMLPFCIPALYSLVA